ncbi:MAG TPA: NAD(P)-dependent oxidoreductase [Planctomycetota bacterium]|nr:NAD(P)-dependent oxidoreductase [Planctomycetota bacterium]
MASSYSTTGTRALARIRPEGQRKAARSVLVTGAAGRIGSYFAEHAQRRYRLRLMVQTEDQVERVARFGETVVCQLDDLEGLKQACAGIDTVLHLAADPDAEAVWRDLLRDNIIGCYHAFVAAKSAGCRRVIFASSVHAVSGYRADVQVKTQDPVNPGDLYGVTKCFGEALGRYMAEQEGLSVIAVRIGAFQSDEVARRPDSIHLLDAFVSQRDLHQLFCKAIDADNLRFAIFHGLSDNRFKRLDISDARELLGYAPEDDATELNPQVEPLHLKDRLMAHNLRGGQESGIRDDVKPATGKRRKARATR